MPSSEPRPNGRLQVFVDPSGPLYGETQRTLKHQFWTSVQVKENVPETKKAGGTILKRAGKSKRVASGPVSSKIAVFGDEDRPPPVPVPSKISVQSNGSKMAMFKDEEMPPPPVSSTVKTPGKPKSGIVPFRDEVSVHLYLSITVIDIFTSVANVRTVIAIGIWCCPWKCDEAQSQA